MTGQPNPAHVLTTEHHQIDTAIERFAATGPAYSLAAWAQPLVDGLRTLRQLDALEALLVHDDVDAEPKRPATMASCHELLNLLSRHNAKEEAVIYPQVGPKLDDAAAAQVSRFLETGTAPDRWTPARASG